MLLVTRPKAAELRAMPEYVQEAVYDELANLTKPYASYNAFNLWQSEAHLYLETLGVSYHQLIDVLQKMLLKILVRLVLILRFLLKRQSPLQFL